MSHLNGFDFSLLLQSFEYISVQPCLINLFSVVHVSVMRSYILGLIQD